MNNDYNHLIDDDATLLTLIPSVLSLKTMGSILPLVVGNIYTYSITSFLPITSMGHEDETVFLALAPHYTTYNSIIAKPNNANSIHIHPLTERHLITQSLHSHCRKLEVRIILTQQHRAIL